MNQNARTWLELPEGPMQTGDTLRATLNDRFRTIAARLDAAAVGNTTPTPTSGGSTSLAGRELILSVPGTLGIQTDAAPRVSLGETATPAEVRALLKQPSQGASVIVKIRVGGKDWTSITLPVGSSEVSVSASGSIAANALITVNLVQVGTVFPGADLTVLVRF